MENIIKGTLIMSFDKLRTNGNRLIPFVVSLSNALLSEVEGHERNQLVQRLLKHFSVFILLTPTLSSRRGRLSLSVTA